MILVISLFCVLAGLLSFTPLVRWRPETFAPIYFLGFALSVLSLCLYLAKVPAFYSFILVGLLLASYLILPIAKTKPLLLMILSGFLALTPFLLYGEYFDYNGFKVLFTVNGIVFLPIITWLVITITDLLLPKIIARFFCNEKSEIESLVLVANIALLGGLGFFFGQFFGLFLVALGGLLAVHGGKTRDFSFAYLLLATLLIFGSFSSLILLLKNPEFIFYVAGQSVMAMFAAMAVMFTYHHVQKVTALSMFIFIGLSALFLVLIPLAGLQKEDIGGPLYMLFFILFLCPVLVVWQIGKEREYLPLLMLTFGVTLFILPKFALDAEIDTGSKSTLIQPKKIETVLSFDQQIGLAPTFLLNAKNEFLSDSSIIQFELGNAPSVTKGSFTKWTGSLVMTSNNAAKLEVNLPLLGMSTNNKYRDESLMSNAYFNNAKTPVITFNLNANLDQNQVFSGKGELKMGTGTKAIAAKFKLIKETETHRYIIGTLEVDRTQFGMLSDPKIGDVVRVSVKGCFKK